MVCIIGDRLSDGDTSLQQSHRSLASKREAALIGTTEPPNELDAILRSDPRYTRVHCLVEAYDNTLFRNSLALYMWSKLRVYCPSLLPWHNPDLRGPYYGESNEHREAREASLAPIPQCVILPSACENMPIRFPCPDGRCGDVQHVERIVGKWLMLLACGVISKAQWRRLILSGCKVAGYDTEASHLCGQNACSGPYHVVPESHSANIGRKSCHKRDRCSYSEGIRCVVGQARTADVEDQARAWEKALRRSREWLHRCPYEHCAFKLTGRTRDSLAELAEALLKHVDCSHRSMYGHAAPRQPTTAHASPRQPTRGPPRP